MKLRTSVIAFFLSVLYSSTSFSQAMAVNISNISVYSDAQGGGCMVKIDPIDAIANLAGIPNGLGEGQCRRGFISFDCEGRDVTKQRAQAMLQAAQLAYVTGNKVYIVPNISSKYNYYCTASRIDNLPAGS